ncbi:hypothetical protein [Magnetofaba australis]|uniref:hypothetical protein n=1 Tax=Magnetofaba australis TaxID=1472297 RepID=UPI000A19C523|nr:hypothetical protein [Magnetofaba australis]
MKLELSKDRSTIIVHIPVQLRRKGGRKQLIAPDGSYWRPPAPRVDEAMVRALARAHKWRRQLDSGEVASAQDLAKTENIDGSYLARVLRLTLLAPDIIEAILDGRQPKSLSLADLMKTLPVEWSGQREVLGFGVALIDSGQKSCKSIT